MKSEIFFLKYAFPCSFVLLSRGEITNKEHDLLYKSAKEEKLYLSINKIESIFWRPLKFTGSKIDLKRAQKYWRFDHNKHIISEKIKDVDSKQCMVIPCEVISVSDNHTTVKSPFLDENMKMRSDFVKAKIGDKVTKHYDYICEKISERLYQKMIESLKKIMV